MSDPKQEDPQRTRIYAAEAEIPSHDLYNIGDVQRFLDEAMTVIAEEPIAAELVGPDDPRIPAEEVALMSAAGEAGLRLRCFGLAVPDERRVLIVGADQQVLSNGLNALHEATHILVPTLEHHGPTFVRAWLDLLDRFGPYQLPRSLLVEALRVRRVVIDVHTSPLSSEGPGHRHPL